jgi:polar amino acid transport system substrate-binding protein
LARFPWREAQYRRRRKDVKKLAVVVAVIGALSLVLAACAPAAPECPECPECPPVGPTTDLGGREVRIAVEDAYPPFNYIDEETGESIGWDYDVGRAICEKLNCEAVFVVAAWEGLFEALGAGEYDVAFDGITLTLARSLVVDYGDPYVEYGQVLLAQADDDRPELADEEVFVASDLDIGTQIGTTNEITCMKLIGEDRCVSYETYDLPITALMAGEVDTAIIDEVAAIGFMGENPGQLKIIFPVTSGEVLAFPFPPLSDLVEPFNWAIQELFADGTMDEICEKWLLRPCSPE